MEAVTYLGPCLCIPESEQAAIAGGAAPASAAACFLPLGHRSRHRSAAGDWADEAGADLLHARARREAGELGYAASVDYRTAIVQQLYEVRLR